MKLLFIFLFSTFILAQDGARQANRDYEEGNYTEAEQGYIEALKNDPDNSRLLFNLGNALAKQGKLEEAAQAFEEFKQLEPNPNERAKADYNLGNSYSDQEQWEEALKQYRKSLRNNPEDNDARVNYELAYRNEQEQEEEQEQEQDQNENQEEQGQDDESESQDSDGQQQQDGDQQQQDGEQQQDQQQQPSDGEQEQQPQDGQQQQQQQQQGGMTAEQADDILKALDNIEKDLLKDYQKRQIEPSASNEKDW
ncbi:MAG: tetratricopeptide repeat protein [Balneolales bacterium]